MSAMTGRSARRAAGVVLALLASIFAGAMPATAGVVVVGPVGTPVNNGDALLAALAGIAGNSAANPFVIRIEPGVYDVGGTSVLMKEFVDIEGSGRAVTLIRGTASGAFITGAGVVTVVDSSELRALTVQSDATGLAVDSAAIVVGGSSARVSDVTAVATGTAPINRAILVRPLGGATPAVLTNVLATAATRAFQVVFPGAEVENLTAVGTSESLLVSSGFLRARNSVFTGPLLGPALGGPMVFVATQLAGPLTCIGGLCRCIAAYDEDFHVLDATCSLPPGKRPF